MKRLICKVLVFALLIYASDRVVATFLEKGLNQYFGLDKAADVLFIGHSHTDTNIRSELVASEVALSVSKYAMSGTNTLDRYAMIKHYFSLRKDAPELVVYDVDRNTFSSQNLTRDSYKLLYPFLDNVEISKYLETRVKITELAALNIAKILRYNPWLMNLSIRSHLGKTKRYTGSIEVEKITDCRQGAKIDIDEDSVDLFNSSINTILQRGSKVLLINMPIVDYITDCDRESYNLLLNKLFDFSKKNPGEVYFLDLNRKYENQYEYFKDVDHLNYKGASLLSNDVASEIANLRKQFLN